MDIPRRFIMRGHPEPGHDGGVEPGLKHALAAPRKSALGCERSMEKASGAATRTGNSNASFGACAITGLFAFICG
jgi:hypothetical protein